MPDDVIQRKLSEGQQAAFYHDEFAVFQYEQFRELCSVDSGTVVDVGGGKGHFAQLVQSRLSAKVRVLDSDQASVDACCVAGIEASRADALRPEPVGDESTICFNLILHHLIGANDRVNEQLQARAMTAWRGKAHRLFVNEYIYDSFLGDASGWLIYRITSSRMLSRLGSWVARWVPSLQANTFGVGVRFRSDSAWRRLFRDHGLELLDYRRGPEEAVSLPRRLLLIRSCRKDSYLLGFAGPDGKGG